MPKRGHSHNVDKRGEIPNDVKRRKIVTEKAIINKAKLVQKLSSKDTSKENNEDDTVRSSSQISEPQNENNVTEKYETIASLNPKMKTWRIKARVHSKSFLRTYEKKDRLGKVFNVTLGDESGKIRCAAFDKFADKFYDIFEFQEIYVISGAFLRSKNLQFNDLPHDYEITLSNFSSVEKITEKDDNIPHVEFNFTKICNISELEEGMSIDIIGVVKSITEVSVLYSEAKDKYLKKSALTIIDSTEYKIDIVLWNEQTDFSCEENDIIAVKEGKINVYNDIKNISLLHSSILIKNLKHVETIRLKDWNKRTGIALLLENMNVPT